ncbi:helix-turn-helix domain-containing protein [Aquimarina algiphila]|uniref:Helix-turn-helix domain-containing protein n=1 Tax=Aquimarina algiphila TaxID=2047982 RepID=A0A554VJ82_9FLAO|nr:helix-turn-helix domain-containing protein [Aquimarina algiphila]TSE07949.1 helix-turn-helix domain-containing protein [Aquimarina algiphila]
MFETEMHPITFIILVLQSFVLFTQIMFVVARPHDKTRLRFLILTITYIFYNLSSGLFPDENIPINIMLQNIIAYASGIVVAVYFIYYTYWEFNIYPFKLFGVKSLLYTLVISFIVLFVLPYYFYGSLDLSRKLFLAVPLVISVAFFVQVTKVLIKIYKDDKHKSIIFKYRVITGNVGLFTLSLMPVVVAFGDHQTTEQSIVNFGFILMMIMYIVELNSEAKKEAIVLTQIHRKANATTAYEMHIADELINDVLEKLQKFEDERDYLKGKITLNILAKRFDTNSRYLSQIVNSNKGKSFTEYINHLRIDYVKIRFEVDEKFRNYTLKAIANDLGYTSTEAFQKAFYKKENIKLSAYLKKLRGN